MKNYVEFLEESMQLFLQLEKASRKKKKALAEKIAGNEVGEILLNLLKDEEVRFFDFVMPPAKEKNDGRERLSNFLRFVEATKSLKNPHVSMNGEAMAYVFSHFDEEEQNTYSMILTKSVVFPSTKAAQKEEQAG
ncbi:hypothetical protein [Cytobacillus oceanisediminis]|uniref:hypothetical protein n=1 Tax=Cytobacillus oceanisediminis TaxID=665099 RepID=UPI001FB27D56|nr:hypothetical protein [Cytobacillus oceanisediminis]UOE58218.1 hypothetical protein IRB79_27345 [Cytobacillus oceanisediminis]